MKFPLKLFAYLSSFIFSLAFVHFFEIKYSYSDLRDYLGVVLTVSAMVFTIMGIWIAFLYPNALRKIVDPNRVEYADFDESLIETRRLEGLVGSVLRSSVVVVFVVFVFLAKIILFPFIENQLDIAFIKHILISMVVVVTFLQLESIFYVIYSNVMFINELHSKREDREADNDI